MMNQKMPIFPTVQQTGNQQQNKRSCRIIHLIVDHLQKRETVSGIPLCVDCGVAASSPAMLLEALFAEPAVLASSSSLDIFTNRVTQKRTLKWLNQNRNCMGK